MEEALEEPDMKFKTKEDNEDRGEEGNPPSDRNTEKNEEGDYDDLTQESDEDALLFQEAFIGYFDPPAPLVCPGAGYTMQEAEKIVYQAIERQCKLNEDWWDMVEKNENPLPPSPLHALPKITTFCAAGYECYHLEYWTEITSETAPNHPYFLPCGMMQVFSLKLSSPLAHPINVYGTFAVRDGREPLRNYLFNCSRDGPATIYPGDTSLPLCSPCRGMFVLQHILIDIDLWVKEERDGFADRLLFSGYVELDTSAIGFGGEILSGRLQGDYYSLDMHFAFFPNGIETLIEVDAEAENPLDVRMSALTSGVGDQIALYDGTFHKGVMVKHFVAVNKLAQLQILMKLDDSLYKWTFQAGVGVIDAPEHAISGFGHHFVMTVSFRTRGKAGSAWQWSCNHNNICVSEMTP